MKRVLTVLLTLALCAAFLPASNVLAGESDDDNGDDDDAVEMADIDEIADGFGELFSELFTVVFKSMELHCQCTPEMFGAATPAECGDAFDADDEAKMKSFSECITEQLKEADAKPPAGAKDFLSCANDAVPSVQQCVDSAAGEGGTCGENTQQELMVCGEQIETAFDDCENDVDEATQAWMDATENQLDQCAALLMQ